MGVGYGLSLHLTCGTENVKMFFVFKFGRRLHVRRLHVVWQFKSSILYAAFEQVGEMGEKLGAFVDLYIDRHTRLSSCMSWAPTKLMSLRLALTNGLRVL